MLVGMISIWWYQSQAMQGLVKVILLALPCGLVLGEDTALRQPQLQFRKVPMGVKLFRAEPEGRSGHYGYGNWWYGYGNGTGYGYPPYGGGYGGYGDFAVFSYALGYQEFGLLPGY
eukprot:Skav209197  [mRNA]  locus=scaffold2648:61965:65814:+ [translate_table: standard]